MEGFLGLLAAPAAFRRLAASGGYSEILAQLLNVVEMEMVREPPSKRQWKQKRCSMCLV